MKLVQHSFEVTYPASLVDAQQELKAIESSGRLCYKSEDRITQSSYRVFIESVIKRGHWSIVEHAIMRAHIVTNRGVTHELVRHRLASYSQESTRYCNYSGGKFGGELSFIQPDELVDDALASWFTCMQMCERHYLEMIKMGVSPQVARGVLPNDLKAEIDVTANLREWYHIFDLRTSPAAHPHMQKVMLLGLEQAMLYFPVVFNNLRKEVEQ